MPDHLVYKIGDIFLQLNVDPGWKYCLDERFSSFAAPAASPTAPAQYSGRIDPLPAPPSSAPIFFVENGWHLYQESGRWIIWIRSMGRDPYLAGFFSPDFHTGEIFTTESTQEMGKYVFPISHPLGELLLTCLLGTGYGIMLHCCAVIDAGVGLVFAGVSTAGKSTTARLWSGFSGVKVINDDHNIIRKIEGQYRVFSTPWNGLNGRALAEDAPLKKIFILKHAPTNQAVRLSPAQAAAALLVRAFPPLWDPAAVAFTLKFLDELCQAVPCYDLGFVPDRSAVEYVRCISED